MSDYHRPSSHKFVPLENNDNGTKGREGGETNLGPCDSLWHSPKPSSLKIQFVENNVADEEDGCGPRKAITTIKSHFGDWCQPNHWKFQVAMGVIIIIEIIVIIVLYTNRSTANSVVDTSPTLTDDYGVENVNDVQKELPMENGEELGKNKNPMAMTMRISKINQGGNPIVLIDSPMKLHTISNSTHTVTVTKLLLLKPESIPSGISEDGSKSVKTLNLSGEISLPWLNYLLKSFPNLHILNIVVDDIGQSIAKDRSNNAIIKGLSAINLLKLVKISATSARRYIILDWGFDINFSTVKTVHLQEAILDEDKFKGFENLLKKTKDSIENIMISESYICPTCDVTELQFDNLKILNITRSLQENEVGYRSPSQRQIMEPFFEVDDTSSSSAEEIGINDGERNEDEDYEGQYLNW